MTDKVTEMPTTKTRVSISETSLGKVAKGKVKQAIKKKNPEKIKLTFKKLKNVTKYQIKISSTKKFKKKKTIRRLVKKAKTSLKIKKFRKAEKLYVKVRGVNIAGKNKRYGAWSKVKRVKVK